MRHGTFAKTLGVLLAAGAALAAPAAVWAQNADRYEPDSMIAPAALVPGDAWIARTFHSGQDTDWFLISPAQAGTLTLETRGSIDTYLTLFDAATGGEIAEDDDSGSEYNARIEYDAAAGQQLLVKIYALYGTTGSYEFQARFEQSNPWEEPNDTREQATPLALGQTVTARFQTSDDHDFYRVNAGKGGMFVAWTEGGIDTRMRLYDGRGVQLADDDDSGEGYNARCGVIVPGAETIYIEVWAYSGNTGSYRLGTEMREAPAPDRYENDDTAPRAKEIVVGTPQDHTFTLASDVDWAKFSVRQAGTYVIRAVGVNSSLDTVLELYTIEQDPLAENDDGGDGLDALIRRYLEPGLYLIKVRCISSDPLADNRYILSVARE